MLFSEAEVLSEGRERRGEVYNTYCEGGDLSTKEFRERVGIGDNESVALLDNSGAAKLFELHPANEPMDRARLSTRVLDP